MILIENVDKATRTSETINKIQDIIDSNKEVTVVLNKEVLVYLQSAFANTRSNFEILDNFKYANTQEDMVNLVQEYKLNDAQCCGDCKIFCEKVTKIILGID